MARRRTERDQMPWKRRQHALLIAALAQVGGQRRFRREILAGPGKWADYLRDKGFDPETSCAGRLAAISPITSISRQAICGSARSPIVRPARRHHEGAEYQKLRRSCRAMGKGKPMMAIISAGRI